MFRPTILVVNDDGIQSPGLRAAVETVRAFGDVVVTAPTRQQTALGRGMVGNQDDFFHPVDLKLPGGMDGVRAWHLDASPALVVQHALTVLFPDHLPSLVVSGINYGENLSTDVGASGTVGAAFEAASRGIPALAVSRQTAVEHHYEYADLDWTDAQRVLAGWLERVTTYLFGPSGTPEHPGRGGTHGSGAGVHAPLPFDVLKIDVPDPCPPGTEERLTRLARKGYLQFHVDNPSPDSPLKASRVVIDVDPRRYQPDDDVYALAVDQVVAVTPLKSDWTASVDRFDPLFSRVGAPVV